MKTDLEDQITEHMEREIGQPTVWRGLIHQKQQSVNEKTREARL
jgi:hypothetical protein